MIKVKYNSVAMPQKKYNFVLNKEYSIIKDKDKYFICLSKDTLKEFNIKFLKSVFAPCVGYSWNMLEEKEITNKNKIIKSGKQQNKKINKGA